MARKKQSFIKKVDWKLASVAVVAICVLEGLAIWRNVDGIMFATALVAISGIAGFKLSKLIK